MAPTPGSAPADDLATSARRVGAYAWLSSALFEVVGGWSRQPGPPELKVTFATQCGHFAWQAGQWVERLPLLREMPRPALVAPTPGASAAVAALAAVPGGALGRAAALNRVVVARLTAALDDHLARTSPVADGPLRRTIHMVRDDLTLDRESAEAVLTALAGADAVPSVGDAEAGVTAAIAAAGGLFGSFSEPSAGDGPPDGGRLPGRAEAGRSVTSSREKC